MLNLVLFAQIRRQNEIKNENCTDMARNIVQKVKKGASKKIFDIAYLFQNWTLFPIRENWVGKLQKNFEINGIF